MYLLDIDFPKVNFYLLIALLLLLILMYLKRKLDIKGFKIFEKGSYDEIEAQLFALDETVNAILSIDQEGLIISANKAVEKMLGYDAKALLHNPLEILIQRDIEKPTEKA